MKKISEHISIKEAIGSPTAYRLGIDNTPNAVQLSKMMSVAIYIFEPVRRHIGKPVKIESMFRSPKLNKIIGGSKNSQHMKGEALDMDDDYSNKEYNNADIFNYIAENLNFDQLIWEFGNEKSPAWVHCSYVSSNINRNKISIAYKIKGKTRYKHFKTLKSFNIFKNAFYNKLPF